MKKSIITSSVVGFLLALGVTPSFAADGKIYAASDCVDAHSSGKAKYYNGRVKNKETSGVLYMECPIVKDDIADTSVNSGHFYVKDMNFDSNISCTLKTQSATNSGSWGWYTTRSSIGTSPTPQKLLYPSQPIYADSGYMVFRCTVPPVYSGKPSWLVSYRIDE
jgi:hypothetical protein